MAYIQEVIPEVILSEKYDIKMGMILSGYTAMGRQSYNDLIRTNMFIRTKNT
jgi:hypothetical protein